GPLDQLDATRRAPHGRHAARGREGYRRATDEAREDEAGHGGIAGDRRQRAHGDAIAVDPAQREDVVTPAEGEEERERRRGHGDLRAGVWTAPATTPRSRATAARPRRSSPPRAARRRWCRT